MVENSKDAKNKQIGSEKNNIETQSLCVNCRHKESCMFLKDAKRPILFCETYEVCPVQNSGVIDMPTERRDREKRGLESEKYKGLCSDCLHRETCMIPKPEGGIWHCEEYE